jgi:hypothetical protein
MPDPYFSSVVLLSHFDGTNGSTTFTDTSSYAHTLTPTSATVTTTSPKFGTGCGNFTATSAALIDTGNAVDFNFGSGQFTVEGWGYFTAAPSGVQALASLWGGSSNLGWFFGIVSASLSFTYSTTGSDFPNVSAGYTPTLNTWIHLAADRDASNVLRVYANGVVIASAAVSSTLFASTQTCAIGNDHTNTRAFPGYLDDVRVTKGVARYGGAFTPPTAAFPDSGVTNSSAAPASGAVAFTGFAPTPVANSAVFPAVGAITFVGFVPTPVNNAAVTPGAGALAFTGYAPSIALTATPAAGAISFTGFAPTPLANIVVSPASGAITFTGFAPREDEDSEPGAGAIIITGFAPTPIALAASAPMFSIIV